MKDPESLIKKLVVFVSCRVYYFPGLRFNLTDPDIVPSKPVEMIISEACLLSQYSS